MITQKYLNDLAYRILGACIEVHKTIGPGLYEQVYHQCLAREFDILGIKYKSEFALPIEYKGITINFKMRCDFFIEEAIVLEIKSIGEFHPIHTAQILSYMNHLKAHRGMLVNFNVTNIYHEGYEAFVGRNFQSLPKE